MSTASAPDPATAGAYYWSLRERELRQLVINTTAAVEEARRCQAIIVAMWPTAKCGEQTWEEAVTAAKQAMRLARSKRTSLRKMVSHMKDTIRIRPHLRQALPDRVKAELEVAERMCDYMDAHGF